MEDVPGEVLGLLPSRGLLPQAVRGSAQLTSLAGGTIYSRTVEIQYPKPLLFFSWCNFTACICFKCLQTSGQM